MKRHLPDVELIAIDDEGWAAKLPPGLLDWLEEAEEIVRVFDRDGYFYDLELQKEGLSAVKRCQDRTAAYNYLLEFFILHGRRSNTSFHKWTFVQLWEAVDPVA